MRCEAWNHEDVLQLKRKSIDEMILGSLEQASQISRQTCSFRVGPWNLNWTLEFLSSPGSTSEIPSRRRSDLGVWGGESRTSQMITPREISRATWSEMWSEISSKILSKMSSEIISDLNTHEKIHSYIRVERSHPPEQDREPTCY